MRRRSPIVTFLWWIWVGQLHGVFGFVLVAAFQTGFGFAWLRVLVFSMALGIVIFGTLALIVHRLLRGRR